ncbi:hypothetical protein URH17368_0851 [Alicyclobacillus hesperidum URH17-3-68]|nr:hypothetical protein URH17368_0851 [Alicyclobacillus hesperidum URH17-3-68]
MSGYLANNDTQLVASFTVYETNMGLQMESGKSFSMCIGAASRWR